MLGNPTECRLHALRCLELAETAATLESRRALIALAETWKGLAAVRRYSKRCPNWNQVRSLASPTRLYPLHWGFVPGPRSLRVSTFGR